MKEGIKRKKLIKRRDFILGSSLAISGLSSLKANKVFALEKEPIQAKLFIDYKKPTHIIPRTIYGHFIEQIGSCIENGLWKVNGGDELFLGGIRWEVLSAVKKLNPSVIRFPGGCYADSYHFKDGIGPKEKRRTLPNIVWGRWGKRFGPDVSNQFGTDEFLKFCEEVNAEPMITVNMGSGTPEEAGDWVEYCNGDLSTEWGRERARNGREKPYRVRYFCVGNEMWNVGEIGHCSAEEYAERFLIFAEEMRKRDPEIKLIAVGFTDKENKWNKAVLEKAGSEIDYLSIHSYYPTDPLTKDISKFTAYKSIFKGLDVFEANLDLGEEAIERWAPENKEIKVCFDEWNLWYSAWEIARTNYNLRDGLFCAGMLTRLQRKAQKVPIACLAQMINAIGLIYVDEKAVFLNPSGWVFNVFTENAYERYLEVKKECDESVMVELSANRDGAGSHLSIFVVNLERSRPINAKIFVAGFVPSPLAKITKLYHPNPFKYNTVRAPEEVVPEIKSVKINFDMKNGSTNFEYSFPEHSLVVLNLKATEG